ncbi:hypothetical protein JXA48_00255 [Candidatus Woesearchaeota archaeon]|nr:hypothetical protein [Candidatus Woesearchaeota archaeon]
MLSYNKFPRTIISNNHSKDLKSVDLVVIPGGDLERVTYFASLLPVTVPIILTGNHYILDDAPLFVESHLAKGHLMWLANSNDARESIYKIPESNVLVEDKSVDHLSAAYFAKEDIESILSGSRKKTVGIISDKPNLNTFSHCLDWNLSRDISFVGFPTPFGDTLKNKIYSSILVDAWQHDLSEISFVPNAGVAIYMEKKHPYFASDPKRSRYGDLVQLARFAKKVSLKFEK